MESIKLKKIFEIIESNLYPSTPEYTMNHVLKPCVVLLQESLK